MTLNKKLYIDCSIAGVIALAFMVTPVDTFMCLHGSDYGLGWPVNIATLSLVDQTGRAVFDNVVMGSTAEVLVTWFALSALVLAVRRIWRWSGTRTRFPTPIVRPVLIIFVSLAVFAWATVAGQFLWTFCLHQANWHMLAFAYYGAALVFPLWVLVLVVFITIRLIIDARRYSFSWRIPHVLAGLVLMSCLWSKAESLVGIEWNLCQAPSRCVALAKMEEHRLHNQPVVPNTR